MFARSSAINRAPDRSTANADRPSARLVVRIKEAGDDVLCLAASAVHR